jgi:hypothetical protein
MTPSTPIYRETVNEFRCQCASCLKPADDRTPRESFIVEVHTVGYDAGPGFWTAKAQGRLAALENRPITDNPWRGDSHINRWEFERGYKSAALTRGAP